MSTETGKDPACTNKLQNNQPVDCSDYTEEEEEEKEEEEEEEEEEVSLHFSRVVV